MGDARNSGLDPRTRLQDRAASPAQVRASSSVPTCHHSPALPPVRKKQRSIIIPTALKGCNRVSVARKKAVHKEGAPTLTAPHEQLGPGLAPSGQRPVAQASGLPVQCTFTRLPLSLLPRSRWGQQVDLPEVLRGTYKVKHGRHWDAACLSPG